MTTDENPQLTGALRALAPQEPLLVALDFDGVCAPLVDDPSQSRMLPRTRLALLGLQASGAHIALISGRSLASLRQVAQPVAGWSVAGGHGAELDDGTDSLDLEQQDLLTRISDEVSDIVSGHPGSNVEHKPTGVVLHTRLANDTGAKAAAEAVLAGPGSRPGVHIRRGHDVVELAVVPADKGTALQRLRERLGVAAALYVGDDVTDEDAFAVLDDGAGDVSVKVGTGETVAQHRIDSPDDVTQLLEDLLAARLGA